MADPQPANGQASHLESARGCVPVAGWTALALGIASYITALIPGAIGWAVAMMLFVLLMLSVLVWVIYVVFSVPLLIWRLRGYGARGAGLAAAPAAILLCGFILAALMFAVGQRTYEWGLVKFDRNFMDRTVASLKANPPAFNKGIAYSEGPRKYIVDAGPPLRVAFHATTSSRDDWTSIVYDPTGQVESSGKFFRHALSRGSGSGMLLFGAQIIGCRHLAESYYACSFTYAPEATEAR